MKRLPSLRTRRILLVVLAVWMILGCGSGEPLQIGFMAGLSGPNSQVGVGARDAALLAVAHINADGGVDGRPLELVVADDQDSIVVGERIVRDFIAAGIGLVIGPFMSSQTPVIERHMESPILFLSPSISTSKLSGRDDNFLRIMPASTEQGRVLLLAMEEDGVRNAVVLYDGNNASYAQELACYLHEHLPFSAIRPLDLMDVAALDDRSVAESVVDLRPEAIVLVTSGYRGALVAQEITKLTDDARFYGTHWTKTNDFIEYGGRAVEGAKLTSIAVADERDGLQRSAYAQFAQAYVRRYGQAPEALSAFAYEAVMITAEGLAGVDSFEPETIKSALIAKSPFEGLRSGIRLDRNGDAVRDTGLVEIRHGAFVSISP